MEIRNWRTLERHPLSAEYEDIKGRAWERFKARLRDKGIIGDRKVIVYDKQVIDGWQLYRACTELDIKPEFCGIPDNLTLDEYVETMNDLRRHETQERAMERADARRERTVDARKNGQSLPAIAAAEGVSLATVRRDLSDPSMAEKVKEEPTTLPPGKVVKEEPTHVVPLNGKATGSDGKERPATRAAKPPAAPKEEPPPLTDSVEFAVPTGLETIFKRAPEFQEIVNQLNAINRKLKDLSEHPAGAGMRLQQAQIDLKNLKETVRFDMPYAVCPVCKGIMKTRKANCPCKGKGWLVEGSYKNLPAEFRL